MITIANDADLAAARVGFHAAFLGMLGTVPDDPLQPLLAEVTSNGSSEEHNWIGELPGMEEWKTDLTLNALAGYKLRITNKKWGTGLRLHEDDFADDKLSLLPMAVAQLAMEAKAHKGQLVADFLVDGFTTGLGYDGDTFFSTTRSTGSNRHTAALDAAGLEAAELLLASQTKKDGRPLRGIKATHLIVGPKNEAKAIKLLTQERLANGEDNVYKGRYQLIVEPELKNGGTFDDYWFLADCSKPIKPFLFQNREPIKPTKLVPDGAGNETLPSFQKGEHWFGVKARYNAGYFEHRLIVGAIL